MAYLDKSALLDVQRRLIEMFSGDTPSKYPRNEPVQSARIVLSRHSANISPVLEGEPGSTNQKFRGMRIYWLKLGSTALTYNGTGSGRTIDCDLTDGKEPESDEKIYTNNMTMQQVIEIPDDDLSGSLENQTELVADRMEAALISIRLGLNTKLINFLDSNKTPVNNDAQLPDGVTFSVGNEFEVDPTEIDMQDPDGFTDIDAIAQNNAMMDYYFLSGRYNFYNAFVNSDYRRMNDNERYLARFGDVDIQFDPRYLDSTLGGKNTFVVGNGTYAIWDRVDVTRTPTQVKDNSWEYFIEDPLLMLNDGGRLRPLRYHVYYQKICIGGSEATQRRKFKHLWEVTLNGGLYVAPPSEDTHTGILKFVTQTAV